jgi:3-hydroxyisobutyrate dehydrogenase-like beta-hydroxyacid dehydrogenase
MPDQRVGLIGLGSMGRGIGKNLLTAGFSLTVYDVNLAAIEGLQQLGAEGVETPRAVAERSDIVVTVLPNGPDVEAVALGKDGIVEGAKPGTIVMDCSTIDPPVSMALHAALAERGVRMVDAAMGRGSDQANDGTLLFMVGAEPEDFEAVRPLLEAAGADVFHVGPPGHGITLKIVHNLLSLTMLAASSEAMILAAKAGLNVHRTLDVLQASTTGHGHLRYSIPNQAMTGDYTPGFRAVLGQKDLRLGRNLATSLGVPLQTLGLSSELFTATVAKGRGDWASPAIITILEEIVGLKLADVAAQQPRD